MTSADPLCLFVDLMGTVEWASGQNTEEKPLVVGASSSEGWSLIEKGLFFLVIIAAVAVVLRMKQRRERQELLREKEWNA